MESAHRALASDRRGVDAVPPVVAVPRPEEVGQRIGLFAILWARLPVGDDAQTGEDAVGVEQSRYDHREIHHLRAGILRDRCTGAMRFRPVFKLVVIAEINFSQTIRLEGALLILRPPGENLLRWAAVAAAGIVDKSVARQSRRRRSQLQCP